MRHEDCARQDRDRRWRHLPVFLGVLLLWSPAVDARTTTPSTTATSTATAGATTPTPTPTHTPTAQRTGDLGTKHVVGRVYDAAAGVQARIAGAAVSFSAPHGSGSVQSDAQGAFAFDLFLHDTDSVTIRAAADGFAAAELHISGVDLWFHESVDLALQRPGARVGGIVHPTVDCPVDTSVVVVLDGAAPGATARRTTAAPDGTFAFEAVPDGDYVVRVETDCPLSVYPPQTLTVAGAAVSLDLAPEVCPLILLLDPDHGPPGTAVRVTGRCYYIHSGGTARIYLDGALMTEVHAGTIGDYQALVQITDDAAIGRHVIRATTVAGTHIGSADFFVGDATQSCLGDCDGDGAVRINELLMMVNIALGDADVTACPAALVVGDETVEITALVGAVHAALNGCAAPAATPTAVPRPSGEGVCYESAGCTWYELGPHHPFSTTRAFCCRLWVGLPFSWCPADQFDAATGGCSACEDPC